MHFSGHWTLNNQGSLPLDGPAEPHVVLHSDSREGKHRDEEAEGLESPLEPADGPGRLLVAGQYEDRRGRDHHARDQEVSQRHVHEECVSCNTDADVHAFNLSKSCKDLGMLCTWHLCFLSEQAQFCVGIWIRF